MIVVLLFAILQIPAATSTVDNLDLLRVSYWSRLFWLRRDDPVDNPEVNFMAGSRAELDITICCGSQESAKTTPAIADKSLSVSMISKSLVQYLRCKVKNCQKREERDHKGNPRVLEQYVELSWHKAGEAAMVFPEKFYILDYCQPLVILGKTAHSGNSSGSEIGVIAMKPQADDEDEKQEQDRKRKEAQERNAKEKEIQKSKEKEKQQQSKKG